MQIPTNLKHKPVFVCENYDKVDGRQAGDTEAKGLSVGLAQWNDRGNVDVSAKIWRYTGEKWSRQSEEMPLHRVLDLAILICRVRQYLMEDYYKPVTPENPQIDRIGIQGDAMTVAICPQNEHFEGDLQLLKSAVAKDDELLGERLRVLGRLLKDLGAVR